MNKQLIEIAKKHLGLETFKPVNYDDADFSEHHILAIVRALEEAFKAGQKNECDESSIKELHFVSKGSGKNVDKNWTLIISESNVILNSDKYENCALEEVVISIQDPIDFRSEMELLIEDFNDGSSVFEFEHLIKEIGCQLKFYTKKEWVCFKTCKGA